MHVFISYDFQDIVCQKLQRLVQAALSFRRKLCGYCFEVYDRKNALSHCKYVQLGCVYLISSTSYLRPSPK